jgi:hypothetical protein
MARPEKRGLDYFPVDTSWETNMKLIKARFKLAGVGCILELWRAIYREGYALRWDEDTQLLFSDENGIDLEDLQKLVLFAAEKGVFSADILAGKGFLTSRGIQKRWLGIAVSSKRNNSTIDPEICLLEVSPGNTPEETPKTPEETRKTPGESTQSKGKERRVINPQGVNYDSSVPEAEFEPTAGAPEAPPSGSFAPPNPAPRSARQDLAAKPVKPAPPLDAAVAQAKAELSQTTAKDFIASAQAAKRQPAKAPPITKPGDDFDPRAPDDFDPVAEAG